MIIITTSGLGSALLDNKWDTSVGAGAKLCDGYLRSDWPSVFAANASRRSAKKEVSPWLPSTSKVFRSHTKDLMTRR